VPALSGVNHGKANSYLVGHVVDGVAVAVHDVRVQLGDGLVLAGKAVLQRLQGLHQVGDVLQPLPGQRHLYSGGTGCTVRLSNG
jgi:hypothetical protein